VSLQSLGKPIARGLTAEVFVWDETRILKLFRDGRSPDQVEYEARIARVVHSAGLPVPAVGEIVEVNGRRGLLYERVDGLSMIDSMGQKLWTLSPSARLGAELHADMHARSTVPELPFQRAELAKHIRAAQMLPPDLQRAALRALDTMPDGDRLCHGDVWPGNVLMSSRGPIIIDWICATRGNPLADVARSSVLLLGALASPPFSRLQKAIIRRVHGTYLRRYFQLRPGDQAQCKAWRPIVAAARLSENVPGVQTWLLATVEAGLSQNG
jgi:Ser/Thr protein kinase RdoA (MazF antagonist)